MAEAGHPDNVSGDDGEMKGRLIPQVQDGQRFHTFAMASRHLGSVFSTGARLIRDS